MPRAARKLTKSFLDKLRRDAKADREFSSYVADAGQPGLAAWARRSRVRFVFEYKPPRGGPRRRMQIDDYGAITLEQARNVARQRRGRVAAGVDPQEERTEQQRLAVTVADAIDGYLADFKERVEIEAARGKRSSYMAAKRKLHLHVLPRLGDLRLRDVTTDHVRRLKRALRGTPVEANRTLAVLSAVFGWADHRELVPAGFNPCRHVERFVETGERRALTRDELGALGAALHEAEQDGTVHPSAILAIRFLALTGFRRSELLGHMVKEWRGEREGLRWKDVDLEGGLVNLHDSKTGPQTRVLGVAAVALLRAAKPPTAAQHEPVCPGKIPGQPFVGIDRPRRRVYLAAGLEGVDLHSLRHSYASIGAHLQGGRFAGHVGPLIGHGFTRRSITERYITSSPEGLRPAADAIASEIALALGLSEISQAAGVLGHPAWRRT